MPAMPPHRGMLRAAGKFSTQVDPSYVSASQAALLREVTSAQQLLTARTASRKMLLEEEKTGFPAGLPQKRDTYIWKEGNEDELVS